ncbi:hypothetical protein F383_00063 [Gossypium arboreum]|uniref:Uncharacterized protein n=1 Tax=Gossypium arboreum TaxID=29729 RepID=A0A0B0NJW9_GOSAR|nr:hypothetical protein F383_00063 [Gossypium arboreum]
MALMNFLLYSPDKLPNRLFVSFLINGSL